jgi:hypothetical protein
MPLLAAATIAIFPLIPKSIRVVWRIGVGDWGLEMAEAELKMIRGG